MSAHHPSKKHSPRKPRLRETLALVGVLTLALLPLWFALGNHPLHARSEARYARVAQQMARAGADIEAWLVPQYNGGAHLTKPPLTYWLMAGSITCFGENELAVRLPAALTGSAIVFVVLLVGRRLYGVHGGFAAAAVLSVMPMFVAVGRLGITDGLLGLCYLGTLAAGLRIAEAVQSEASERTSSDTKRSADPRPVATRWVCVFWVCVAVGLFNKGPVALLPVGVVTLWFALGGRWRALRAMRALLGGVFSALPLGAWVGVVWWQYPGAWGVWWHEIVDRAAGSGDHARPWWYLLPVLVVGLFPATVLWAWPGLHRPWSSVRDAVRRGSPEVLWTLGILAPLLLFTAISGKLMSYLMPAAPCAALLAGEAVAVWLRREERAVYPKPPLAGRPGSIGALVLVAVGVAVASWVLTRGVVVEKFEPYVQPWIVWPATAWGVLSVVAWALWRFRPRRRVAAAAILWAAATGMYLSAAVLEMEVFGRNATPGLVQGVRELTGYDAPMILTVGYEDASLAFYTGRDTRRVDPSFQPDEWAALDRHQLVLVAEPATWKGFEQIRPTLMLPRYQRLGEGTHASAGDGQAVWVFTVLPGLETPPRPATAPPR